VVRRYCFNHIGCSNGSIIRVNITYQTGLIPAFPLYQAGCNVFNSKRTTFSLKPSDFFLKGVQVEILRYAQERLGGVEQFHNIQTSQI